MSFFVLFPYDWRCSGCVNTAPCCGCFVFFVILGKRQAWFGAIVMLHFWFLQHQVIRFNCGWLSRWPSFEILFARWAKGRILAKFMVALVQESALRCRSLYWSQGTFEVDPRAAEEVVLGCPIMSSTRVVVLMCRLLEVAMRRMWLTFPKCKSVEVASTFAFNFNFVRVLVVCLVHWRSAVLVPWWYLSLW